MRLASDFRLKAEATRGGSLRISLKAEANAATTRIFMLKIRIRRLHESVALAPVRERRRRGVRSRRVRRHRDSRPGEVRLVPTGLVVEVPAGMFLAILARSSTPLKRGLMVAERRRRRSTRTTAVPTDEVKIAVVNFRTVPVQVKAGDRIAQGIDPAGAAGDVGGDERRGATLARRVRLDGMRLGRVERHRRPLPGRRCDRRVGCRRPAATSAVRGRAIHRRRRGHRRRPRHGRRRSRRRRRSVPASAAPR